MHRRMIDRVTGACFAAALVVTTMSMTQAAAEPAAPAGTEADAVTAAPEMLAAMQRDLGLTAEQARTRIVKENRANALEPVLEQRLGASYAGAWLSENADHLVVATTDPAEVDRVRSAGAEARVVARTEGQLDAVKAELDRTAPPSSVPGWYVDPKGNELVVLFHPSTADAAHSFVETAGVDPSWVRLVESPEAPRPLYDVRGGDAYYMGSGGRCSVGFSVEGGFVTAGHCGSVGTSTSGHNQAAQGTFRGSLFPGSGDYAWVETNSNWTPTNVVNGYSNGNVTVAGSQESSVGSSICRSGSTTGWHCGTVQAKNQSVSYPQGTVTGMTRTTVCAEPGDSGGAYLTGQQAQGVTSGGSGNCSSGGTTFFQPVNEILSAYGLTLVTDGGGGDPPPPPPPGDCGDLSAWNAGTGYVPGDMVSHNGRQWESTWYSTGAEPGAAGSWAVWRDAGAC
ncbi:streptogrisin C [Amycolatopsis cihanbeyliensis]|uniref:Streptogrisin C n=1 Tax=Amycolatopsis cihanbeyliensis TaxID=1128664 RepID=A0A542DCV9_AMYCI|nr:streptogrisin C [Amycolatopsis cihanbeyliensis]